MYKVQILNLLCSSLHIKMQIYIICFWLCWVFFPESDYYACSTSSNRGILHMFECSCITKLLPTTGPNSNSIGHWATPRKKSPHLPNKLKKHASSKSERAIIRRNPTQPKSRHTANYHNFRVWSTCKRKQKRTASHLGVLFFICKA